jgi:AcrR family transcriptional regulator
MPRGPGRYDEILETFTRHIAEVGYDGTNFGTVAAQLGVSKGTIVHHFGTKDRILAALHERYVRRRIAELDLILERLDEPAEQLAAVLHAFHPVSGRGPDGDRGVSARGSAAGGRGHNGGGAGPAGAVRAHGPAGD